jgi:hypothetical protein
MDDERLSAFMARAAAAGVAAWVIGKIDVGEGIHVSANAFHNAPPPVVDERWGGSYVSLTD